MVYRSKGQQVQNLTMHYNLVPKKRPDNGATLIHTRMVQIVSVNVWWIRRRGLTTGRTPIRYKFLHFHICH